jgi:uncharacterized membrane protein
MRRLLMRRLLIGTLAAASLAACGPAPSAPESARLPAPAAATGVPPAPVAPTEPAPAPITSFRAVGQEPGWFATVGGTPRLTLHVEADYGEIVFDAAEVRADATGWTGRAPDGAAVTLRFQRVQCADAMSGREYPTRTTLTIGESRYSGCGEFAE